MLLMWKANGRSTFRPGLRRQASSHIAGYDDVLAEELRQRVLE
jgi:hypothetical protein